MVGTRIRYSFRDEKTSSLSETMKMGAFADRKKRHFEEPQLIIPDLPFCTFFAEKVSFHDHNPEEEEMVSLAAENEDAKAEEEKNNGNLASPAESRTDALTMVSTNDDFIMKTPFAKPSGEKFELGKFFREWQTAPLLETFKELPPIEGLELQKQLDTFESDLNEYDSIVQSLCQSSLNNN